MRILLASDTYPPVLGGLELHVQQLGSELARRGHQVDVATLAGAAGPQIQRDGSVTVFRLAGWSKVLGALYADPNRPFHPTIPDPGIVAALAAIIRDRRVEIVHAHSWILYSLLPILPSRQTVLVATMHDYGLVCPKKTLVFRSGNLCSGPRFEKCVACAKEQYGPVRSLALTSGLSIMRSLRGRVERYIAVSDAVAQGCSDIVRPNRPQIEIIPPFLPDAAFASASVVRPDFVPQRGDYFLFAGALTHNKGLSVLMEAWRGLVPTVPLVLAGLRRPDTPNRFPRGVIVAENVPHADVLRAWAHCLAAIVPSTWPDPHPLVAMEAMAAGRPVVASAVGGLVDIVKDGNTGFLVQPGNVRELRSALQRLLDNPALCARMGEAGRRSAGRFAKEVVVQRVEDVYHDAISARTQRHRGTRSYEGERK